MKTVMSLVLLSLLLCSQASFGEDFLGVPMMEGGKDVIRSEDRVTATYEMSMDQAVNFYRKVLENEQDVKFRERNGKTLIEDQSSRPWHSIRLIEGDSGTVKVVITGDRWTWILGTLVLRFFGVFMVLLVLYLAMEVSGRVLSRLDRREAAAATK